MKDANAYIQRVYFWMFVGLLITAATAFYVSTQPSIYEPLIQSDLFIVLLLAQLVTVGVLVAFIRRIPDALAEVTFVLYTFITGLTFSVIFLVFTISSIGLVFFITAGMFGFMSVYGYFTKTDLTSLGHILTMLLFGLVLSLLMNLFLQNQILDIVLSLLGVLVFSGLAAHDTQKIKEIYESDDPAEDLLKKEIIGALDLYLDFVNLFLSLIRLMGRRR